MPGEALRVAVKQTRLRLADVTFFNLPAAQRTVCVRAGNPVIDENEPCSARNSTRYGTHRVCAHVEHHLFAVELDAEARHIAVLLDYSLFITICHRMTRQQLYVWQRD